MQLDHEHSALTITTVSTAHLGPMPNVVCRHPLPSDNDNTVRNHEGVGIIIALDKKVWKLDGENRKQSDLE